MFSKIAVVSLSMFGFAVAATAQPKSPLPRYFPGYSVPSPMRQIVSALGDRVQKPGNERVIVIGTLKRSGISSTLQVIRQMPGYLRIDEAGGKNRSLAFDFTPLKGSSPIDSEDEDLAESLDDDTAESFLSGLAPGVSIRRLGDLFAVKGDTGFGATVDIYEMVSPVKFKQDKQPVVKRFMFDSKTGLLRRVVYSAAAGGSKVLVQTVYSDYSNVGGYVLPGTISRQVAGSEAFAFTRTNASIQPGQADGVFSSTGR